MATARVVWIHGKAFSPNHPLAIAHLEHGKDMRLAAQGGETVPDRRVSLKGDCSGQAQTLNKTEQRYWDILQSRLGIYRAAHHTIKLQLAEKCWYTPDFSFMDARGLVFVETKGAFERDDAIVKLKTAARLFPQFTFIKAKFVKGKWTETVMPK